MAFLQRTLVGDTRRTPLIALLAASGLALSLLPGLPAAADEPPPSGDAPSGAASSQDASSKPSSDDREALRRELEREEARIRALEQRLSRDEAAHGKDQGSNQAQGAGSASAAAGAAGAAGQPAAQPSAPFVEASRPGALSGNFGPEGFTFETEDGENVIHLRGNLSLDYRRFDDSYTPETADTFLVRRARPTIEGTLDGIFDFRLMPDFAQGKTVLQDAWVAARAESWLVFQVGKFKSPVGLERLQLEEFSRFIEASLTSDLLPYRDIGFEVRGDIAKGLFTYQVGVFDGAPDGQSTESNSTPDFNTTGKFVWVGRLFAKPFRLSDWQALKAFGIGVAATYVDASGTTTPTSTTSLLANYKTTGQQPLFSYRSNTANGFNNATIASGIERRLVPQANYYIGPFGLLAEYVQADQQVSRQLTAASSRSATLHNHAWQVQGYFFLTGEKETYDQPIVPNRSVTQGGIGAWELVARYHELHFDDAAFTGGANSFANPATAARNAHAFGVGINWYLAQNFRLQFDFEQTSFEGGAANGDRPDERVLTTQFMLVF
jgi:phosphate-selective porin OprO and OprP